MPADSLNMIAIVSQIIAALSEHSPKWAALDAQENVSGRVTCKNQITWVKGLGRQLLQLHYQGEAGGTHQN
jgi:hypothetical protein